MSGLAAASIAKAARADDDAVEFDLSGIHLRVPKPFIFPESVPPPPGTLPPHVNFAFWMPDGRPAGSLIQFPPISRPLPDVQPDGAYVVMGYRLMASKEPLAGPPAIRQLGNWLISTEGMTYRAMDGMLQIKFASHADDEDETRYASYVDHESKSGLSMLLKHVGASAMYYFGRADVSKPDVAMTIYIPASRISSGKDCLLQANRLIQRWSAA